MELICITNMHNWLDRLYVYAVRYCNYTMVLFLVLKIEEKKKYIIIFIFKI